jgi:hypothetical protein
VDADDAADLILSVSKAVKIIHRSPTLRSILRLEQEEAGLNALSVKEDVVTRWNSSFMMVERVLQVHKGFTAAVLSEDFMLHGDGDDDEDWKGLFRNNFCHNGPGWSKLQDIVACLKPVYKLTLQIQGENYPTLPEVAPAIGAMKEELQKIDSPLATSMRVCLEDRFENWFKDNPPVRASLFHPKFASLAFIPEEERAQVTADAIMSLKEEVEFICGPYFNPAEYAVGRDCYIDQCKLALDNLQRFITTHKHLSPAEFWGDNGPSKHPPICSIRPFAAAYLSIPATSAPAERCVFLRHMCRLNSHLLLMSCNALCSEPFLQRGSSTRRRARA